MMRDIVMNSKVTARLSTTDFKWRCDQCTFTTTDYLMMMTHLKANHNGVPVDTPPQEIPQLIWDCIAELEDAPHMQIAPAAARVAAKLKTLVRPANDPRLKLSASDTVQPSIEPTYGFVRSDSTWGERKVAKYLVLEGWQHAARLALFEVKLRERAALKESYRTQR